MTETDDYIVDRLTTQASDMARLLLLDELIERGELIADAKEFRELFHSMKREISARVKNRLEETK